MVIKYVLIVEGMDTDGERNVYTAIQKDASTWDVLGLLDYARLLIEAQLIKTKLES